MGGSAGGKKNGNRHEQREARNARSKAYINLAHELAAIFSAGVYTKDDLQSAVCGYVAEMKEAGESGDDVVRSAQSLAAEVGARFPESGNTGIILGDLLTWCLAEYYRESA
jgi:hypothetical protein